MQNEIKVSPSLESYWMQDLQNTATEGKVAEKKTTRKFIVDTKENESIISEFSEEESMQEENITADELNNTSTTGYVKKDIF